MAQQRYTSDESIGKQLSEVSQTPKSLPEAVLRII